VEIGRLKTRLSELVTTFSSNLNEENTVLLFSEDELEGVPKPLLDSFEKVSLPLDVKGLKM
jgi:saccharolysin